MHDADPHDPFSRTESRTLTRRRVIGGVASIAGVTATGGAMLSATPGASRASVAVDGLTVPDASFETDAVSPDIDLSLTYGYAVSESADVSGVRLAATVGGDVVAEELLSTSTVSVSDATRTLTGPVVAADAWSDSDFAVSPGESIERTLEIGAKIVVEASGGDVLASDAASTTATVTVTHPDETVVSASISGTGRIVE